MAMKIVDNKKRDRDIHTTHLTIYVYQYKFYAYPFLPRVNEFIVVSVVVITVLLVLVVVVTLLLAHLCRQYHAGGGRHASSSPASSTSPPAKMPKYINMGTTNLATSNSPTKLGLYSSYFVGMYVFN